MTRKVQNIYSNLLKEKKFFKNLSYLSLVELVNISFPLLIVPMILSKVGMEGYGKSGLAQSVMLILCVITDWGFNITAIRDIARIKNDTSKQTILISNVFTTKLLLLFFLLLSIVSIVMLFPKLDSKLYLGASFLLIGKTFTPNWYFSALEENKYNVLSAFFSNFFYLILLFFFLKTESDYWKIVFLQGIAYFLVGLLLIFVINQKFGIPISILNSNFLSISEILKEGKEIFLSNISLQVSAYASPIILSWFVSPYILGLFTLCQKLVSVVKVLLTVFSATMHQRICNLVADEAFTKVKSLIKNIYLSFATFFMVFICIIGLLAPFILSFFTEDVNDTLIYIFRINLLVPIVTLFNIIPYLLLLAHNYKKEFSRVTIPSSLLLLILLLSLTPIFQINGVISALVLNELFIVLYLFYQITKTPLTKIYGIK